MDTSDPALEGVAAELGVTVLPVFRQGWFVDRPISEYRLGKCSCRLRAKLQRSARQSGCQVECP